MMNFELWAQRWPEAAAELREAFALDCLPAPSRDGGSEAKAQQAIRLTIAGAGGLVWRNNVGATPAKEVSTCPRCQFQFTQARQPVRYGLCNDSHQLNERFKSSDLIGLVRHLVTPADVGRTIGRFIAIEVKRPGWQYSGSGREVAQTRFIELVKSYGGLAQFATGGDIKL